MDRPPSLLVVTATLGRSQYLERVFGDLNALEPRIPLQHILVAPPAEVAALRQRRPRARVIAESPGGPGLYAALNLGVAAGEGWKWMTYLNDDDRLYPGFVDVWAEATAGKPLEVVYGDVDYLDAAGATVAPFPICSQPADIPALLAGGIAPFTQQGTLVSADLWNRLGGFDASWRLAADFDFWVRAGASGARFSYVRTTVAGFRIQSGQLSSDVERVQAEMASVLGRGELRCPARVQALALSRFRLRNASRILWRILRTGRFRSRRLLAGGT